ncbi:MAG: non-hydrolyzing UDP-N-acetylglucosamine 2-epimerase [Actinomycetota bacterium]
MKVLSIAGARPNFMKVAPVMRALSDRGIDAALVHTGQHYDPSMSAAFFSDLGMREPDVHLEVGSASHALQTARVMKRLEPVVEERQPDLVVVVGDVNSTLAGALVCAKLGVPVAHVEAGLRSFDRTMPEEINRVLTDQVSDLLFTTSPEAETNLLREGVAPDRIHFVGNPMIDSLERHLERARGSDVVERLALAGKPYGLVTLHRPSNVDDPEVLSGVLGALADVARELPLVFPAHPRTVKMIRSFGFSANASLMVIEPLGYLEFLRLLADARLVLTDSGGIQEETTVLGVPCLTLRDNTERPITIEMGTNKLVGSDPERIRREALASLKAGRPEAVRPPLWDGKAGERIADVVAGWGEGRAKRET